MDLVKLYSVVQAANKIAPTLHHQSLSRWVSHSASLTEKSIIAAIADTTANHVTRLASSTNRCAYDSSWAFEYADLSFPEFVAKYHIKRNTGGHLPDIGQRVSRIAALLGA